MFKGWLTRTILEVMVVQQAQGNSAQLSRIVERATELIHEHGLAGFSMRLLARELGQQPSALYWHVADKQTLLALVAERLLQPVTQTALDESPVAVASSFRQQLLSLTDGAEIVLSTLALGLGAAAIQDRLLSAFERAGAERSQAGTLANTLMHYCLGHVLHEQQRAQAAQAGILTHATETARTAFTADDVTFRRGAMLICGTGESGG